MKVWVKFEKMWYCVGKCGKSGKVWGNVGKCGKVWEGTLKVPSIGTVH